MARELKPCGTPAAYNRHRAHGEEACEDCKRAMADYRAAKRGNPKPQETMADRLPADTFQDVVRTESGEIDFKAEYVRLYRYLNGALPAAMPREVAALVREMRGLLVEIRTFDKQDGATAGQGLADAVREAMRSENGSPDTED